MRTKKILLLTGIVLSIIMTGCSSTRGLTKEEKVAKEVEIREAIENRTYKIDVDRVIPMSGSSRTLTSLYSLEINGDKVKSHLPYFGRAYSVPYGGGEGLIFESTITDYKSSFDSKGKSVIEFKTRTKEDQYVYNVEISTNGTASINVRPNNRQSISFHGKASPKK
jgi:hypothetical protein